MAYFVGQGGSVQVSTGGSSPLGTICVESWNAEVRNDAQDVSTTCSNNWVDRIAGMGDATLNFTGFYDAGSPIFTPVTAGARLNFVGNIGSSGDTLEGTFIVSSVGVENPAKTTVKFNVTALSSGEVTVTLGA